MHKGEEATDEEELEDSEDSADDRCEARAMRTEGATLRVEADGRDEAEVTWTTCAVLAGMLLRLVEVIEGPLFVKGILRSTHLVKADVMLILQGFEEGLLALVLDVFEVEPLSMDLVILLLDANCDLRLACLC